MPRDDNRTDADLLRDYAEGRGDPGATEDEIVRRGLRVPAQNPPTPPRFRSRLVEARRGRRLR